MPLCLYIFIAIKDEGMGDGEEKRKMKDGGSKFCRKKLEENSNETDGVAHCFSCLPIIFNNCNSLLQALIRFLGFQLHTQHPHHSSSSPTANGAYHLISSSPELCYPGGSDLPPTMADPPPDGSVSFPPLFLLVRMSLR